MKRLNLVQGIPVINFVVFMLQVDVFDDQMTPVVRQQEGDEVSTPALESFCFSRPLTFWFITVATTENARVFDLIIFQLLVLRSLRSDSFLFYRLPKSPRISFLEIYHVFLTENLNCRFYFLVRGKLISQFHCDDLMCTLKDCKLEILTLIMYSHHLSPGPEGYNPTPQ